MNVPKNTTKIHSSGVVVEGSKIIELSKGLKISPTNSASNTPRTTTQPKQIRIVQGKAINNSFKTALPQTISQKLNETYPQIKIQSTSIDNKSCKIIVPHNGKPTAFPINLNPVTSSLTVRKNKNARCMNISTSVGHPIFKTVSPEKNVTKLKGLDTSPAKNIHITSDVKNNQKFLPHICLQTTCDKTDWHNSPPKYVTSQSTVNLIKTNQLPLQSSQAFTGTPKNNCNASYSVYPTPSEQKLNIQNTLNTYVSQNQNSIMKYSPHVTSFNYGSTVISGPNSLKNMSTPKTGTYVPLSDNLHVNKKNNEGIVLPLKISQQPILENHTDVTNVLNKTTFQDSKSFSNLSNENVLCVPEINCLPISPNHMVNNSVEVLENANYNESSMHNNIEPISSVLNYPQQVINECITGQSETATEKPTDAKTTQNDNEDDDDEKKSIICLDDEYDDYDDLVTFLGRDNYNTILSALCSIPDLDSKSRALSAFFTRNRPFRSYTNYTSTKKTKPLMPESQSTKADEPIQQMILSDQNIPNAQQIETASNVQNSVGFVPEIQPEQITYVPVVNSDQTFFLSNVQSEQPVLLNESYGLGEPASGTTDSQVYLSNVSANSANEQYVLVNVQGQDTMFVSTSGLHVDQTLTNQPQMKMQIGEYVSQIQINTSNDNVCEVPNLVSPTKSADSKTDMEPCVIETQIVYSPIDKSDKYILDEHKDATEGGTCNFLEGISDIAMTQPSYENVLEYDSNGLLEIHRAVLLEDADAIWLSGEQLRRQGHSVDQRTKPDGYTPLHLALLRGCGEKSLRVLLWLGASPLARDGSGRPAILLALQPRRGGARAGRSTASSSLHLLPLLDPDVLLQACQQTDGEGLTALMQCAINSWSDQMKVLLQHTPCHLVDLPHRQTHMTALHMAMAAHTSAQSAGLDLQHSSKCIELLKEYGASLFLKDSEGNTPEQLFKMSVDSVVSHTENKTNKNQLEIGVGKMKEKHGIPCNLKIVFTPSEEKVMETNDRNEHKTKQRKNRETNNILQQKNNLSPVVKSKSTNENPSMSQKEDVNKNSMDSNKGNKIGNPSVYKIPKITRKVHVKESISKQSKETPRGDATKEIKNDTSKELKRKNSKERPLKNSVILDANVTDKANNSELKQVKRKQDKNKDVIENVSSEVKKGDFKEVKRKNSKERLLNNSVNLDANVTDKANKSDLKQVKRKYSKERLKNNMVTSETTAANDVKINLKESKRKNSKERPKDNTVTLETTATNEIKNNLREGKRKNSKERPKDKRVTSETTATNEIKNNLREGKRKNSKERPKDKRVTWETTATNEIKNNLREGKRKNNKERPKDNTVTLDKTSIKQNVKSEIISTTKENSNTVNNTNVQVVSNENMCERSKKHVTFENINNIQVQPSPTQLAIKRAYEKYINKENNDKDSTKYQPATKKMKENTTPVCNENLEKNMLSLNMTSPVIPNPVNKTVQFVNEETKLVESPLKQQSMTETPPPENISEISMHNNELWRGRTRNISTVTPISKMKKPGRVFEKMHLKNSFQTFNGTPNNKQLLNSDLEKENNLNEFNMNDSRHTVNADAEHLEKGIIDSNCRLRNQSPVKNEPVNKSVKSPELSIVIHYGPLSTRCLLSDLQMDERVQPHIILKRVDDRLVSHHRELVSPVLRSPTPLPSPQDTPEPLIESQNIPHVDKFKRQYTKNSPKWKVKFKTSNKMHKPISPTIQTSVPSIDVEKSNDQENRLECCDSSNTEIIQKSNSEVIETNSSTLLDNGENISLVLEDTPEKKPVDILHSPPVPISIAETLHVATAQDVPLKTKRDVFVKRSCRKNTPSQEIRRMPKRDVRDLKWVCAEDDKISKLSPKKRWLSNNRKGRGLREKARRKHLEGIEKDLEIINRAVAMQESNETEQQMQIS